MMKSTELRIGNYIDFECANDTEVIHVSEGKVTEIHNDHVYINTIKVPRLDMLKPILLTEEWLLKLGLVKYKDAIPYSYVFHLEKKFGYRRFRIQYAHYGDGSEGFYNLHLYNKQCKKVMYVHELQNLYFALTGTELELTP